MNLGIWEILLIALVVLLLFGGKKIPELMRGLGKGVRSFKDGVNGIGDEPQSTDGNRDNLSEKEDERQTKG
ncbi:MAG: twin-arginine translocase TatA/TatE family subunit [Bacteroidales bacterium]|nr:twin-arginine translocase TatA/TatE family subunit [Bacteroidales bacterium]